MSERDPIWDDLKRHSKDKFDADRAEFMKDAEDSDDGGWTKHTEHHWSRKINGENLDYWPTRKKYQWRGKVRRFRDQQEFKALMKRWAGEHQPREEQKARG